MYQKIFLTFFKNKKFKGFLELEFEGHKYVFGEKLNSLTNKEMASQAKILVHNKKFFKRVILFGDIGFGESFFGGEFTTPDLKKSIVMVCTE